MIARNLAVKLIVINTSMHANNYSNLWLLDLQNQMEMMSYFDKALRWDITDFYYDFAMLAGSPRLHRLH
jgi:hypothetical protein